MCVSTWIEHCPSRSFRAEFILRRSNTLVRAGVGCSGPRRVPDPGASSVTRTMNVSRTNIARPARCRGRARCSRNGVRGGSQPGMYGPITAVQCPKRFGRRARHGNAPGHRRRPRGGAALPLVPALERNEMNWRRSGHMPPRSRPPAAPSVERARSGQRRSGAQHRQEAPHEARRGRP